MRINAETAKRDEAFAKSNIKSIEAQAAEQYARDKAAEESHRAAVNGRWELDVGSGYMYNSVQRYYCDVGTGMYYGGDPMEWTAEPKMPKSALYSQSVTEEKGDVTRMATGDCTTVTHPMPASHTNEMVKHTTGSVAHRGL